MRADPGDRRETVLSAGGLPVVVGMDFTPAAKTALLNAFAPAGCLKTSLRVVHSWTMRTPATAVTIPFLIDLDELEAPDWMAAAL